MQILKKLYQVGGDLNGVTWDGVDVEAYNDCNTYIIERPEGLILVDCGCGDTLEQIFDNMRYWDLDPKAIRYCILTHPHMDHTGAGYLLKQMGVSIISSQETAEAVSAGDERCCPYLYHKTFTSFTVDKIVSDGEIFNLMGIDFKAMHLPGHSMGCTIFFFKYEGKSIVISGDVIGTLLAGDFGWSGSIDFDRSIYMNSLQRFAKIDTDMMLPGHGLIYFHKPRRRVEEAFNSALMQWRG